MRPDTKDQLHPEITKKINLFLGAPSVGNMAAIFRNSAFFLSTRSATTHILPSSSSWLADLLLPESPAAVGSFVNILTMFTLASLSAQLPGHCLDSPRGNRPLALRFHRRSPV